MQEKELIEKCIDGHRVSQKKLYDTYKVPMYTLAYRITNNFEDAEDVLQEGFLKVFRNLKGFNQQSALSTWIYTIIVRTAYRKIKDNVKFTIIEDTEDQRNLEISYPSDIEYLEKAIQALPNGYRTVFTLYEIEGFKHHEIAELLEISVNTSKTQLRNAKITLREQLKPFAVNG